MKTITAQQLVDAINVIANGKSLDRFAYYVDIYSKERLVDLDTSEVFDIDADGDTEIDISLFDVAASTIFDISTGANVPLNAPNDYSNQDIVTLKIVPAHMDLAARARDA